jgi:hypothetical protein
VFGRHQLPPGAGVMAANADPNALAGFDEGARVWSLSSQIIVGSNFE